MEIKIRMKTPLWTGGVDGTMDRIHETGIIGSLRWWYEAIVRGLGGWACDPSGHTCPDNDGNYCDVCTVFGATGLQRAFRLEGPVWQNNTPRNRLKIKVGNNRGWYLGRGFLDEATLRFLPLRLPEGLRAGDLEQTLLLALELIAAWGGIGPKTQQGYGVVDLQSKDVSLVIDRAINSLVGLTNRSNRKDIHPNSEWPSLARFFWAKVRFSEDNPKQWIRDRTSSVNVGELRWYLNSPSQASKAQVLPLAPVVRYHLRGLIRDYIQCSGHSNAPARWRLMGVATGHWHNKDYGKVVRGQRRNQWLCETCSQVWSRRDPPTGNDGVTPVERQASLIHVSHAYLVSGNDWEFRIWGWLPDELPGNVDRNTILRHLRQWLGVQEDRQWCEATNGDLWNQQRVDVAEPSVLWFEQRPDENGAAYLQCLLAEQVHKTGVS